jgi:hypothetical protein
VAKKEFTPMEVIEFLRRQASKGGKAAAKALDKPARVARAKKAAKASAKVRTAKAKAKAKKKPS